MNKDMHLPFVEPLIADATPTSPDGAWGYIIVAGATIATMFATAFKMLLGRADKRADVSAAALDSVRAAERAYLIQAIERTLVSGEAREKDLREAVNKFTDSQDRFAESVDKMADKLAAVQCINYTAANKPTNVHIDTMNVEQKKIEKQ
jgi:hypothetical protein